MAQMIIRNIPEEVMDDFRKLAKRRGNSAENEVRELIAVTVERDSKVRRFQAASRRRLAAFASQGRIFSDSTELIRDDRDR